MELGYPHIRIEEREWDLCGVLPEGSTLREFMQWLQVQADAIPREYKAEATLHISTDDWGNANLVITHRRDETAEETAERIKREREDAERKAHAQKIHDGMEKLGVADWRNDRIARDRMMRLLSGAVNSHDDELGLERKEGDK